MTVVLLCAGFLDYHELGGIYDWYYNPYGEFATETVNALDRLGCSELAGVLYDILNSQLSCEKLSQLQRGDLVRRIREEDLNRIDQKLAELRGTIPERLVDYIAEHEL